jgi:hypothetical protein
MHGPAYTIQLCAGFQCSALSLRSQLRQPNIGHEESLQNHKAQLFAQVQAIRDAVGLAHTRSVCTSIQTSNGANDKYEQAYRFSSTYVSPHVRSESQEAPATVSSGKLAAQDERKRQT